MLGYKISIFDMYLKYLATEINKHAALSTKLPREMQLC